MNIGKRISEIRKNRNVTQEFITGKLDKTPQWLSNIERGIRPIAADELAKIASILKVDPSIFFEEKLNKTCSTDSINNKLKTGTSGS